MSDSSADRDPLERLAEEFVARFRAGERPSLTEYAERNPELADQIRDLFPALVEMEQLKPGSDDRTGPYAGESPHLEHLTGFRILREVGRGGMGVVYEAVQESLGRHVALKVLPDRAVQDPKRRERFRREARAAARLHHTNIVPVFQTGEVNGVHFYAMQFIVGSGLDQVVLELRRLREGGTTTAAPPPGPREPADTLSLAQVAACSLVTASFEHRAAPETLTFESALEAATGTVPGTPVPSAPAGSTLSAPESALSSGTGQRYWESVARLGVQAAGALAHAHSQGVLHRDIKPSNLLLDGHGTLWVTDFGLAKIAEDEDLTAAGDILGTLRYMSPERFEGRCDARADIYALGLTLYEMLTLRPAFDETGREKLIALVTRGQPVKPSKLNPRIPRDLETIVMKAIAREPEARYQSAAEMAEDLECFVQDRPIRARRASTVEKLVRWSRRNPGIATLTGTLAVVLITVAVGATLAAFSFRDLADSETKARGDAEQKQRDVEDEKRKLVDARDRLNRANAFFESGLRRSKRGEWAAGLADLTSAIELKPDNSQVWSDRGGLYLKLGLAEEAAADFARLFELRNPDEPTWWAFHAALRLYVGDREGYRAACRKVRRHFPDASSPEVVRAVVQACTLGPDGTDDPQELVRFVDQAAELFPTEPFGELRIAALFRAGMYAEVVAVTNPPSAATGVERAYRPAVLCFRAMSLARLNNVATSRASLTTARDKLDASAAILALQTFGPNATQQFVGTFPPAMKQEDTIDWVVDDLLWREAGAGVTPAEGAHPLPLFVRARGCAAIGQWDRADAATAEAVRLCPDDPKQPRLADVALLERARLNAIRDRWTEVAADFAAAQACARPATRADTLSAQITALYTAFGRHEDARRYLSERIAKAEKDVGQRFTAVGLKQERALSSIQLKDWPAAAADLNAIMDDPSWIPKHRRSVGGGWGGGFIDGFFPGYTKPGGFGGGYSSGYFNGRPPVGTTKMDGDDHRAEIRKEIVRHDELYKRVSAVRPNDTALRHERGKFLAAAKRWDEAREFYLVWLANPPKTGTAFPLPGETQIDADRRSLLVTLSDEIAANDQVFEPIAEKYPNFTHVWTARYHWLVRGGDFDRAADAIVRAFPSDVPKGAYGPPQVYTMAAENDEVFNRIIAKRPNDAALWMARFQMQIHRQEPERAKQGQLAAVEVIKRSADQPQWVRDAVYGLAHSANPERALELYAEVRRTRPEDPDVHMGYCLLHVRLKKWDEAVTAFDSAIKAVPPVQPGMLPRVTVPSLYGMLPTDETTFAEFTNRRPKDARLWLVRGRIVASTGKDPVDALTQATILAPKDPEVWLELARAHADRRRWKEAATAYDKHIELLPVVPLKAAIPNGAPPYVYGEIVGRIFTAQQGRQLLAAVLELRPNDARLRFEMCRALRGPASNPANTAARAELDAAFEALLKAAPKEPVAWLERARYRMSVREVDKAAEDFATAGKLLPRQFFEKESWPVLFPMFSEIAGTPQLFAAYTALAPDDPFPWYFRGWYRREPSHPEHATWYADLTRAIDLQPDEPRYRFMRRTIAGELGLWDRVAADCSTELKRPGTPVESFLWLEGGCAYAAAGNVRAYRAFCRRMFEAWGDPEDPVQRQRLVMTMLLLPNPEADVQKMLEHALVAFKNDPRAWWNTFAVAVAHVRVGQPARAAEWVRDYLKKPDFTRWGVQDRLALEFLLAVALARDGRKAEARAVFDESCKQMDVALYVGGRRKPMTYGHIWATCEALRREADGLLNNVAPPPRPAGEKPN